MTNTEAIKIIDSLNPKARFGATENERKVKEAIRKAIAALSEGETRETSVIKDYDLSAGDCLAIHVEVDKDKYFEGEGLIINIRKK